MSKHWQESEIEFRRKASLDAATAYPHARGLIVHQYGGTLEECIRDARSEFKLGDEWEVVASKKGD